MKQHVHERKLVDKGVGGAWHSFNYYRCSCGEVMKQEVDSAGYEVNQSEYLKEVNLSETGMPGYPIPAE